MPETPNIRYFGKLHRLEKGPKKTKKKRCLAVFKGSRNLLIRVRHLLRTLGSFGISKPSDVEGPRILGTIGCGKANKRSNIDIIEEGSPSHPRTYYLGTGAFKGPLGTYYLGTWGARERTAREEVHSLLAPVPSPHWHAPAAPCGSCQLK